MRKYRGISAGGKRSITHREENIGKGQIVQFPISMNMKPSSPQSTTGDSTVRLLFTVKINFIRFSSNNHRSSISNNCHNISSHRNSICNSSYPRSNISSRNLLIVSLDFPVRGIVPILERLGWTPVHTETPQFT